MILSVSARSAFASASGSKIFIHIPSPVGFGSCSRARRPLRVAMRQTARLLPDR
jgi:hypothetical protein